MARSASLLLACGVAVCTALLVGSIALSFVGASPAPAGLRAGQRFPSVEMRFFGGEPVTTTPPPPAGFSLGGVSESTYVISMTILFFGSDDDEIGMDTLVGEYAEKGVNHNRMKVYQKTDQIEGHENMSVFLYYWDSRDGDHLAGWWFGDQVGGTQVWARSQSETPWRRRCRGGASPGTAPSRTT
ncbi:unnamed protein product [Prorocentrum cordatum]|uniref:Subtilisin n=1 Tax=Prorocentrum cordatum TaxID=2364126 RepID=A0ABN9QE55_9DINO|nr:unnamed protein product [Polarella glacialis]